RDDASGVETLEIPAERGGEIRAAEREVHQRLEEPELVARVVAYAVDLARVQRPILQQPAQSVGQLNLTGAVARRGFEGRKGVGGQDIAADDRQIRRRVLAPWLLH